MPRRSNNKYIARNTYYHNLGLMALSFILSISSISLRVWKMALLRVLIARSIAPNVLLVTRHPRAKAGNVPKKAPGNKPSQLLVLDR